MDKRIEIWDVLHDGEITVFEQEQQNLTMFVSIPYLRSRLRPLGDSLVLTLSGVKEAKFVNPSGNERSLREELDLCQIMILSAESQSMPVSIAVQTGTLVLDFEEVDLALDTGQHITYEEVRKACEEYWAELGARGQQSE